MPFDAPKLRDLKRLAPVHEPTEAVGDARPSPLKAGLFVLGIILMIAGAISGWSLYRVASPMLAQDDFEKRVQMFGQTFDDASPADVWRFMELILEDRELPPFEQAEWRTEFQLGQLFRNVSYGLWGLAGVGLILVASSLVMLSREKRTAP